MRGSNPNMPHHDVMVEAAAMPMTETAYAKINLALHVRARRDDGYHALESIFAFAEDGDELSAQPRDDGAITLLIDGPFAAGLDVGGDNLVMRAARALDAYLGGGHGAALRLTKNLPVASGIGGGSADAAATLRLLCRLWGVTPSAEALSAIALSLGSDVPACLASRTSFVGGRGEEIADIHIAGLDGAPLLLVNPGIALSTGPVFAGWDREDRGGLLADSIESLVSSGRNDLESSALSLAPVIADVIASLRRQHGVLLARMSGSGATCFALFHTACDRDAAAALIAADHPGWWTMTSRIRSL